MDVADLAGTFEAVVANVRSAYVGSDETIRLALCALLAGGHVLIEDYPGVGKTTLAKALARSLGLEFGRVQFTADLLPADITGAVVVDHHSRELGFRAGPVFTNVLLADELNRASPKAQSALLEAMEERQVSADGTTRRLPVPFMVVATQNPHDVAGTFPLPHSQLDRFLLRLGLGYPDRLGEDELLAGVEDRPLPEDLPQAASASYVLAFASVAAAQHVSAAVRSYIVDLVEATRRHGDLVVGASPRAGLAVLRAARALAVADGRPYVLPDDVKRIALPALAHRVVAHPSAGAPGADGGAAVVAEILARLPVPVDAERR